MNEKNKKVSKNKTTMQNNFTQNQGNTKENLNLNYGLEIERIDEKNLKDKGYDFIPRLGHFTSSGEQELKTKEIENKTK
jgi:hypothetical protein